MMNNDFVLSVLKQFKALPETNAATPKDMIDAINRRMIAAGIFIMPDVFENVNVDDIQDNIIDLYGVDDQKINSAGFYSSFKQVHELDAETLFANQIMHYFSTYGLEALGVKNVENYVYVPATVFNLPEDHEPYKLTIIRCISEKELRDKVMNMLTSGVALKNDTQDDLLTIIDYCKWTMNIDQVENKEFKIRMYDHYHQVPSKPVDFLRYVMYKITGSAMLINKYTSLYSEHDVAKYFDLFNNDPALASIFFRYKKIFLSIKKTDSHRLATRINRIRKLADKYHKPVGKKPLELITSSNVDFQQFKKELDKVTIFKKIALANSLIFYNVDPTENIYFIRNGSAFVKNIKAHNIDSKYLHEIMQQIVSTLRKNVEGKAVYLPDNIVYAMPTSEKLFWNNIPYNSYMEIGSKSIVAIHWYNKEYDRVDLDLSMMSKKYQVSWYNQFDNDNFDLRTSGKVVFSGDKTDAPAPEGATEAYYINEGCIDDELITFNVNLFTQNEPVDFQLFLGDTDKDIKNRDYLITAAETVYSVKNTIHSNSLFIGFLDISDANTRKFYFTSASIGNSIISAYNDNAKLASAAMRNKFNSCLKLNDLLRMAGAKFEREVDEEGNVKDWDINLDPQQVTKDVFISLLKE